MTQDLKLFDCSGTKNIAGFMGDFEDVGLRSYTNRSLFWCDIKF